MRVLIVEDEPNLGRQLRSTLEGAGYAVDLATDGEEVEPAPSRVGPRSTRPMSRPVGGRMRRDALWHGSAWSRGGSSRSRSSRRGRS